MHMIYKALVHSMPDVHLRKLQGLVHQCFTTEIVTLPTLRSYDYAMIAQTNGQFIGALFARISMDKQQHEISKFCVAPHMQGGGLGADMLDALHSELSATDTVIVLYVDPGIWHDRLVSFYERNGLFVVAQNEIETMMASKLLASPEAYKGNDAWPE
jgi:ribosomal protein S18 acetylase RimI-like enzyme